MIRATFTGSNPFGHVTYFGQRFETGIPVVVSDSHAIASLSIHPEFECRPVDPLDHDGNGKRGGSRKRKAR